jgi:hypothetical protein
MKLKEGCIIFIWVFGVRRNYPFHQNEFSTKKRYFENRLSPILFTLKYNHSMCMVPEHVFCPPKCYTKPYELQIYNQARTKIRLH